MAHDLQYIQDMNATQTKESEMKCFICKKEIQKATQTFLEAKNGREKDRFRDLCDDCYTEHWTQKGYVLQKGKNGGLDMWVQA